MSWIHCECGNYWCTVHAKHVFECPCPPIDEWTTNPYEDDPPMSRPATLAPSAIRDQIRELVATDGRSIAAIARTIDPPMSRQHLSAILHGTKAAPSIETIERVLAGLGCRLAIVRQ